LFVVFDTNSRSEAPQNRSSSDIVYTMNGEDIDTAGILVLDTSMIVSGAVSLPAQRRLPHLLDEKGAANNCSSYMSSTKELLVGREEGVFSYSVEDRGGAAGFEGEKQGISAVGRCTYCFKISFLSH
jgi:hypothetical protein